MRVCLILIAILFLFKPGEAQVSPKKIEARLANLLKQHCDNYCQDEEYLDAFSKKFIYCLNNYNFTIKYPFEKLKSLEFQTLTSPDSLVRIYSWPGVQGGDSFWTEDAIQYSTNDKVHAYITDSNSNEAYFTFDTLNDSGKVYYILIKDGGGACMSTASVRIFTIENGKLNTRAKIIKTKSGLTSNIIVDYNYCDTPDSILISKRNEKVDFIEYDVSKRIIYIPIVTENMVMTTNHMTYKFDTIEHCFKRIF